LDDYVADSEETQLARTALIRLLKSRGAHCSDEDLSVRKVQTRKGHALYVVIALNGTEHALARLVNRVAGRRQTSVGTKGVFLLRPNDLVQLVSKIVA